MHKAAFSSSQTTLKPLPRQTHPLPSDKDELPGPAGSPGPQAGRDVLLSGVVGRQTAGLLADADSEGVGVVHGRPGTEGGAAEEDDAAEQACGGEGKV